MNEIIHGNVISVILIKFRINANFYLWQSFSILNFGLGIVSDFPQNIDPWSKRPRIYINSNPPFQTQIYLVKRYLNVNIVKLDLPNKKQFLKILWSEVWKGGFQLMQILGLLSMHFDAVVVEVETFYFYSDWLWPYCG